MVGYAGETVNKLRVWAAEPVEEHFDLEAFNRGDYALDDAERAEVDALVERLTALVISDDVEAVKAGIEALTKGTETLAERRMDRSIREALSGMSVDDEMFDEKPEDESKNH